ncbi:MAG: hypothetical protein VKJ64_09635 [Leptolyngbyaceae bacterium]|nr:hypothetical protein [Leptolyngbyaceae bacterium]
MSVGLLALTSLVFLLLGRWQKQLSLHLFNQLKDLIRGQVSQNDIPIQLRLVSLALGLVAIRFSLWIGVIFYITQLFPATQKVSYALSRSVIRSFLSPIFPLGGENYSLVNLIILGAAFLGMIIGASLITNVLRTRIITQKRGGNSLSSAGCPYSQWFEW